MADPFVEKTVQLHVVTFTAVHKLAVKESDAQTVSLAWIRHDATAKTSPFTVPHHEGVLTLDLCRVESINVLTTNADAKRDMVEALSI